MSGVRIALLMGLLGTAASFVHADTETSTSREEITVLLHELGASHCAFFRNGSWYDSIRAEAHLKRKLEYFEHKNLLSTADAFIADAASRSSMSGEIYQVRCPGRQAQPSAEWLRQKLGEVRRRAPEHDAESIKPNP